ncbi:SGNH/GDSL hydrolase family protein [Paraflavitalea pollutisoli]|uniref:SGNH/GDSL hydrolase family protein n=1 Tax=Paraflavitalea pollutisoli TaxID=3034143 RepID=UPI0023ED1859|nr:GDSL-type esterase/lipase family protein [Paraflavitalea sp. H1-2-19X]
MKKILFILALVALSATASAQTVNPFPTTDSLRKFINKWIRNSAVDAFTNLRLNSALLSMTRFIDSSINSSSGVDTFYAVNPTTLRLVTTDGRVMDVTISSGTGGTNSNIGSGYRWAVPGTNNIKTQYDGWGISIDSISNTNALTVFIDSAEVAGYFLRRKDSTLYVTPTRLKDTAAALRVALTPSLSETYYDSIYRRVSWTSGQLSADFTNNGATVSVNGQNNLAFSGGTNTWTQTLDLAYYTCLEKWRIAGLVVATEKSTISHGFAFGTRSTNGYGASHISGRFIGTTTGNGGKVSLHIGSGYTQVGLSDGTLSWSAGDTLEHIFERNGQYITVGIRNKTTNSATVSTSYSFQLPSNPMPNTGRFAVYSVGGSFVVDSLSITSDAVKYANIAVIGDSKVQAYSASDIALTWPQILASKFGSITNLGGGSDRSTELLTRVDEVIKLAPKQILLQIPSNDVRSGISDATSRANYQSLVSQYRAGIPGVHIYHLTPSYETSVDLSEQRAWLQATYSQDSIIDVYKATIQAGSLSVDNVHLSNTGMVNQGAYIMNSGKLRNLKIDGNSIQGQTITDQNAGFRINGPSSIKNSLNIGDGITSKVQWRVRTSDDAYIEGYNFSGANVLTSVNGARNAGVPFQTSGSTWEAGTYTGSYKGWLNISSTGILAGDGVSGTAQFRVKGGADITAEIYALNDTAYYDAVKLDRSTGKPIKWWAKNHDWGTFNGSLYIQKMRLTEGGNLGIATTNPLVGLVVGTTDAIGLPVGTTVQRPTGATGYLRWNTDSTRAEVYNGSAWVSLLPGSVATGIPAGTDDRVMYYASNTIGSSSNFRYNPGSASVGIGGTPSSNSWLVLGANSTTKAGLRLTSGTVMTTPIAGSAEYDGTSLFFSPSTTRLRVPLTDNSIPSNGQIPIGNGTNYTNATLTGSTSVSVTNGSGSITLAIPTTYITSGTYTPTITNGTNIESSTAFQCNYMRVGSVVTVSGQVNIDPTAAVTSTVIELTLPISVSSGGTSSLIAGAGSDGGDESIRIYNNGTTRAVFFVTPTTVNAATYSFTFSYTIF